MRSTLILAALSTFAYQTYAIDNFVINGHDAEPNSAPFIVSMQLVNRTGLTKKSRHRCGGSILNENWVKNS